MILFPPKDYIEVPLDDPRGLMHSDPANAGDAIRATAAATRWRISLQQLRHYAAIPLDVTRIASA